MIAILGGLGAALCWTISVLCSSRSTRMIGGPSVLAWVMLVGFAITVPLAASSGIPKNINHGATTWWLMIAALGIVGGLLLQYAAFLVGRVSIIAPIASTGGAIAAAIAALTGEVVGLDTGAMLALIVTGVLLASIAPGGRATDPPRAALLTTAAACGFGAGQYATARIGDSLPVIWALLPARVLGVAAVAVPLAIVGRLRLTKVGSSRVDLQACKLEYSIVSPK